MNKIQGDSRRAMERGPDTYELFVGNNDKYYSIEIKEHELTQGYCVEHQTFVNRESLDFYKGLAQALQSMGLMPESAVDSELKATKYHLEDMRSLALKISAEL